MQKPHYCAPLGVQPGPCRPGYVPPCLEAEERVLHDLLCDSFDEVGLDDTYDDIVEF
jgi:hypothetical protein